VTFPGKRRYRRASISAPKLFGATLASLTILVGGCSENGVMSRLMLKPDHIIIERRPDPAYDRLFPYYVDLCATSQFRSKLKGEGGVAGHAVMYIKGACKDERASFPQLRRCKGIATEFDDPEHGAGVSVGRWFRNVNWVAVPGYKLFSRGASTRTSDWAKSISKPRCVMQSTRTSIKASTFMTIRMRALNQA
jgi:hypothetical protein